MRLQFYPAEICLIRAVQVRVSYFRFSLKSPHALSLITPHHKGYFSSPVGQEDSSPVGQGSSPVGTGQLLSQGCSLYLGTLEGEKGKQGWSGRNLLGF